MMLRVNVILIITYWYLPAITYSTGRMGDTPLNSVILYVWPTQFYQTHLFNTKCFYCERNYLENKNTLLLRIDTSWQLNIWCVNLFFQHGFDTSRHGNTQLFTIFWAIFLIQTSVVASFRWDSELGLHLNPIVVEPFLNCFCLMARSSTMLEMGTIMVEMGAAIDFHKNW